MSGSFGFQKFDDDVFLFESESNTQIYLSKKWSSADSHNREFLGNFIEQHQLKYVSISHGRTWGGFATSQQPVGFDLEERSRVTEAVVRRVCEDDEYQALLRSGVQQAFHWCAKESAWKSLRGPKQPRVIGDLFLEWKDAHTFTLKSIRNRPLLFKVSGCAMEFEDLALSWALSQELI